MTKNKIGIPKLRFPGFTEPWEQRKLGDLAEIVRGASPRPIKAPKWFDNSSDIGWLRIADVTEQNGQIYHLEQHISKLGQEKTRVLTTSHLLLSIAASVGKPVINHVKTGVHDGFLIFLNPQFNINFMYHWFEMYKENWKRFGQPGSQVNLNSDLVKNQEIRIPNNDEQEKISSFFQQLDNLITLHQRKLDDLKTQKKGLLQKMFPKKGADVPEVRFPGFTGTWEQRKLGKIVNIYSGKDYKHLNKGNIPVYGTGGFMLNVDKALSENENAVGIGRKGTIDKPYILEAPFWTVDTLFYAIPYNTISLNFIYCIFQKINWKKYDESTGVPSLSKTSIKNVPITITGLKEQQKIGTFFQQFDNLITLHQRKLEHLQLQKKGLLQQMFV